ncbi:uncharacterized protein K02A2.6-like [Neodiprion lecontei]|uniref:RNA-directed DNA polymerase n=1 Tax=Neodiprion lecontei TaxID=441921 RepID=A0ABM3GM48_NEOLC|nr:uncharacterized protein K02A2.6-like [Neodiprion lecontei]
MGLFEVNVLLDGLKIAPRIFQKFMDSRLQGIPGVLVYLDNIKIQGQTRAEHDDRLREVLKRLSDANLRLNTDKCVFGVPTMEFLGYRISDEGIKPLATKVEAIKKMPAPNCVKDLQAFLGGLLFYERFLEGRATIAEPLHRLLDADTECHWTKSHQEAFNKLKDLLINAPILWHFDDKKPIVVSVDVSPFGLGAVLAHTDDEGQEHSVTFASKTLTKTQRRYSQIDREALALVFAVTRFHQYLAGRKFILTTDHKPLLGIFNPTKPTPEIVSPKIFRYSRTLSAYNYELIHRPGKKNGNADMLSRLPLPEMAEEEENIEFANALMIENSNRNPVNPEEIAVETSQDTVLKTIKNWVIKGWPRKPQKQYVCFWSKRQEISLEKGCLVWGNRVIIPKKLQRSVLNLLHGNHPGIVGTKVAARTFAWWPRIDQEIESLVKNCKKCMEIQHALKKTPTENWTARQIPWNRIHLDFAGPFEGQLFLVMVDVYTKWVEVRRVPSRHSRLVIKELGQVFATFGVPDTIVSDNDTAFSSLEIQEFYKRNGIKSLFIAPYNPQANGQAERTVQSAKNSLRKLKDGDWETRLSRFLLKQHSTPVTTTGKHPLN